MSGVDTVQPAAYGSTEEGQNEHNEAPAPKPAVPVEYFYTVRSIEYFCFGSVN